MEGPSLTDDEQVPPAGLPTGIASPLTLILDEERAGSERLEEALFLSFTADLGFFEEIALGVTQATGARVTVVGDAAVTRDDPRSVRRAGRTYLAGLAWARGAAFHPKLMVLAGPDRATIALGSGNTTLAGWQANSELWTVLRVGKEGHSPAALPQLSAWLRGLPDHVRFSAGVPGALERVADLLDRLHGDSAVTAPRTRVVSSLRQAILDQLPHGPVDELAVFAPFHDRRGLALRRLLERFRPGRFTLAYQPGLTDLNGPEVADLLRAHNGRVVCDNDSRYRHGKLIEWSTGGQQWALTGSPNLSAAALLRAQDQGGNCELGIITPLPFSLLPVGTEEAVTRLRAAPSPPRPRGDAGPLLLGAARVADGMDVTLAHALGTAGHLELSPAAAPPEVWERVADVPSGKSELTVAVTPDAGSRVRLVTTDGAGALRSGNIVFVVDPVRVLHRMTPGRSAAPTTRPTDLFTDPRLAERFLADLETLRTELGPVLLTAAAGGTGAAPATADTVNAPDGDTSSWEYYLDACSGRIGRPLTNFALGLPMPPTPADTTHRDLPAVFWDERIDERICDDVEAALDEDNADTAAAEPHTDPVGPQADLPTPPDLRHAAQNDRRRYRRWVDRLVERAPEHGPVVRMLIVRLVLWTVAAGAWPSTDTSWLRRLSDAVRELARIDLPPQVESQAGSLAAVATAVLRSQASRYEVTPETHLFNVTSAAVAHLLPAAEPGGIHEYAALLDGAFGTTVDPAAVLDIASEVVQDDPVADAAWALSARGRDIHRHGRRLLHLAGSFGNPALVALEAVGAAESASLVGAWAGGPRDAWALILWHRPDLVVVESRSNLPLWRHYQLGGLVGPKALAAQRGFDSAYSIPHGPRNRPFDLARRLLADLDLSAPEPPARCVE